MPTKNTIYLSKILGLDINQVLKLYDLLNLSDLAALTSAVNQEDSKTMNDIFKRYAHKLKNLPDANAVQDYYQNQMNLSKDARESIAATSEHFGIREEDVKQLLTKIPRKELTPKVHDDQVQEALVNIKLIEQGRNIPSKLSEVKYTWQRRMLLGQLQPPLDQIIQKIWDMTPEQLQDAHNASFDNHTTLSENPMSLNQMMEDVLQSSIRRHVLAQRSRKKLKDNKQ